MKKTFFSVFSNFYLENDALYGKFAADLFCLKFVKEFEKKIFSKIFSKLEDIEEEYFFLLVYVFLVSNVLRNRQKQYPMVRTCDTKKNFYLVSHVILIFVTQIGLFSYSDVIIRAKSYALKKEQFLHYTGLQ